MIPKQERDQVRCKILERRMTSHRTTSGEDWEAGSVGCWVEGEQMFVGEVEES